ncbi:helix-turn-helix domain-containing protein [Phenylobacterium aquaticum]|uniref:helix-turn-helix domain-containing protein n=1 Tax=Phenylobacterium aquaticum TaxID=1763816 RepID=UPI0026F0B02A|nr:helix-turn-helix domain-containing protein [Phenylobacterium aquaticum]
MFEPPNASFNVDQRRQLARLASHHFLNTASLIAETVNSDLITALTFLTISRANVRELVEDGVGVRDFAALEAVPPDDLRRAVSVYAVARELGIPYETVRRHARKLRNSGVVEMGPEGLTIPRSVYGAPGQIQAVAENWGLVRAFVSDANRLGVVAAGPHVTPSRDVRRQAVRLSIGFFLDNLAVLGRGLEQDALSALVFLAIGRGNLGHLAHDAEARSAYVGLAAIPPDEVRRPVSVYAVAKGLNLPYETTRRYGIRLVEQGWAERSASGALIIPASVVARPSLIQGVIELAEATQAYLAQMIELGVPVDPA